MAKIKFRIATPERVVYESEVDSVTCPTEMGEVTILPKHIPLVANLKAGELKTIQNGQENYFSLSGGFLEVRTNNEIVILADSAEHAHEIDMARAEEARGRAKKLMAEEVRSEEEYAVTAAALERALARIRVARRRHKDVGRTAP
ncbi:MAG: F0F1 ATP synthase subunit epsilon [Candidatus Doudnabacteria bacterium]|nr:F0F1 ATP synthase subunit epsilon [bacterium]MDZ4243954.1 F0F1 ATP synthase subunit epsilon [Candidatus Doudnabacteria bacterium]